MARAEAAQLPLFETALPEVTSYQEPLLHPSELTVLSFGGGQDSSSLLYMLALDPAFRARYAPRNLLVIMSDTGNEHPATLEHVTFIKGFCKLHDIEFVYLTADMGYHSDSWQSLKGFYHLKGTIGSRAYVKSCTDQLKLQPIYRYINDYLSEKYGFTRSSKNKKAFGEFVEKFESKISMLIGIAAGEETRCAPTPEVEKSNFDRRLATISHMLKAGLTIPSKTRAARKMVKEFEQKVRVLSPADDYIKKAKQITTQLFPMSPIWRRESVQVLYPLIPLGLNRKGCQEYMASTGLPVPPPSNCKICPFLGEIELLWLHRFLPEDLAEWVELERVKIEKHADKGDRNLGVWGKKLLPEVIAEVIAKHGHMTDLEVQNYKFSHGHCVASQY